MKRRFFTSIKVLLNRNKDNIKPQINRGRFKKVAKYDLSVWKVKFKQKNGCSVVVAVIVVDHPNKIKSLPIFFKSDNQNSNH